MYSFFDYDAKTLTTKEASIKQAQDKRFEDRKESVEKKDAISAAKADAQKN